MKPPKTKAEGQSRALRMLRDLYDANADHYGPVRCGKMFDAVMRDAMTWPAPARRGFSLICGDWLANEALGMGYALDGYAKAVRRDKRGTDVA